MLQVPLILNIETSGPVCSVCISHNGKMLGIKEELEGNNHASILTVLIQELFEELGLEMNQLDAVAVSAGPGSYTGLRIGVVTAKGFCYALDKPLIAIDSLEILKEALQKRHGGTDLLYCPTIDARRDEIYFALYAGNYKVVSSRNIILQQNLPFDNLERKQIIVGGSAADKCRNFWKDDQIIYDSYTRTSSRYMHPLAELAFSSSAFENVASFTPEYIKPVYVTSRKQ